MSESLNPYQWQTVCDACGKLYNHEAGKVPALGAARCSDCVITMNTYNRDCLTEDQWEDLKRLDASFKFALEYDNQGTVDAISDPVALRLVQEFLDANDERLRGASIDTIKTELFNAGLIIGIFLSEVGRAKVLLNEG